MGKNMGYQYLPRGDEFEITVLEVCLNCKKQYPKMANYLPQFAEA